MPVAKEKIAEAIATAEIHGDAAHVAPHIVAEAHEAAQMAEALSTLKKAVDAKKERFKALFAEMGVREMRDAQGRTVAVLNEAAPIRLDQKMLRERFPRQAEECTHPAPYTYVAFKA